MSASSFVFGSAVARDLAVVDAAVSAALSAPVSLAVLADEIAGGSDWDLAGGSLGLDGGDAPARGFVVGGVCESLVFDSSDCVGGVPVGAVVSWLSAAAVSGALADADVVGWWLDEDDGAVYVDLSTVVASEVEAVALGASRGELAVWDLGGAREIRCCEVKGVVSGAVSSL